jgi:hypothetical protein
MKIDWHEKLVVGGLAIVIVLVVIVALASCGSRHLISHHTPRPVFTTKAQKAAKAKAERDGFRCIRKYHLHSLGSGTGRAKLADCMGFTGKVKTDLETCLENQAVDAGSLLNPSLMGAAIDCFTTAELAAKS